MANRGKRAEEKLLPGITEQQITGAEAQIVEESPWNSLPQRCTAMNL
jgi:hypothetical protein